MKKPPLAAVIDIGSGAVRMQIAQVVRDAAAPEAMHYLENVSYPLSLGRDTFTTGKISFDKVDKACALIKNFLHLAKGYGVRAGNVRTVASTAIREAGNINYILDQIKIKTGVDVHVMDDLEEKRYIYKLLAHYSEDLLKKSAVIVYIGTGSIGVNLITDGKMPRTWNIRVGSLRMSELFGDLQDYTREFYRLMEEYLAGFTYKLSDELPAGIKHFIVTGQDTDTIVALQAATPALQAATSGTYGEGLLSRLEAGSDVVASQWAAFDAPVFDFPRKDFEAFYEKIKRKTPDRISADYNIDAEKAESILPAACIFHNLLACTDARAITASRMLPSDAVLFETLHPKRFAAIDKRFDQGTQLSAKELAKRHRANIPHGELVQSFAAMIFARLRKLHGLGKRDELLLDVAAYLHDIGESVNTLDHHKISHELIRRSDIVGLTQAEQEIVALICRNHTGAPRLSNSLPPEATVRISKLAAMLRLADAMDRSHTQKSARAEARFSENTLLITLFSEKSMALEQWAFRDKARFFEEVFGIKAELRVKKV